MIGASVFLRKAFAMTGRIRKGYVSSRDTKTHSVCRPANKQKLLKFKFTRLISLSLYLHVHTRILYTIQRDKFMFELRCSLKTAVIKRDTH